jgi:MFS transporter, ACS family, allantoate permease
MRRPSDSGINLSLIIVQFLDKNTIGAASILGFIQDNHLTNQQFNNLGTFFYVGLLASQPIHAIAFQKLPVAKYLGVMMFLWAFLVGMTCAASTYAGLCERPFPSLLVHH